MIAQSGDKKSFRIENISISSGWYNPNMDYWNNTFFPDNNIDSRFKGNISFGGNIEFSLPANFRVKAGLSYWSTKVEPDMILLFESFKISFTRFTLGCLYIINIEKFPVKPYIGMQGSLLAINNVEKINDIKERQYGQDYSYGPIVGLEKVFSNHILIGAEFQYQFGNYIQEESSFDSETVDHKVSIAGPEFCLKVGYKF